MGAWGYDPFDNDNACDFWDEVLNVRNAVKMLKEGLVNNSPDTRRSAVTFLTWVLEMDYRELKKCKKLGVQTLEDLLSNEEFINSWDDPKLAKRRIKSELKRLKAT